MTESKLRKRSVIIQGRKTSISLEDEFWEGIKEIATARGQTITQLVNAIDAQSDGHNLSSAIRVFVMTHFRSTRATPPAT